MAVTMTLTGTDLHHLAEGVYVMMFSEWEEFSVVYTAMYLAQDRGMVQGEGFATFAGTYRDLLVLVSEAREMPPRWE